MNVGLGKSHSGLSSDLGTRGRFGMGMVVVVGYSGSKVSPPGSSKAEQAFLHLESVTILGV